jgi:hypothetical protein
VQLSAAFEHGKFNAKGPFQLTGKHTIRMVMTAILGAYRLIKLSLDRVIGKYGENPTLPPQR